MAQTIFSPADIYLPMYQPSDERWMKWSVIACDQFTSEIEYWENAYDFVGDEPSTLHLILPEAFLEGEKADEYKKHVLDSMNRVPQWTTCYENALIYIERILPDGHIRRGIVGKIDLDHYDYHKGANLEVLPTEATVEKRIPPRVKIRAEADYELPHIMVFSNAGDSLISYSLNHKNELTKIYDFDLMAGGGHLTGYLLTGEALKKTIASIEEYEKNRTSNNEMCYAIGDGNHSLAAAKAFHEQEGTEASRYALCEIVDISDDAIEFEPIYRIIKNCNPDDVLAKLTNYCESSLKDSNDEGQRLIAVFGTNETALSIRPKNGLVTGALQDFIDEYVSQNDGTECDYIHGEQSVKALSSKPNTIGFVFEGIKKEELFSSIDAYGVLPRKTFSMGSAYSKRYYTEIRKIK